MTLESKNSSGTVLLLCDHAAVVLVRWAVKQAARQHVHNLLGGNAVLLCQSTCLAHDLERGRQREVNAYACSHRRRDEYEQRGSTDT